MNFKEEQSKKVEVIETILKEYLPEQEGYQKVIMEAMEYSVMAGGKRLRPMLMQEVYKMFGGSGKEIEPFMAAIEMIHTYSLVRGFVASINTLFPWKVICTSTPVLLFTRRPFCFIS